MNKAKELERCIDFLTKNGWLLDAAEDGRARYYRRGYIGIELNTDTMTFLGGEGDFLHRPTDYYTMVGVLLEFRQLPINYKSVAEK